MKIPIFSPLRFVYGLIALLVLASCNYEPDKENFYTFTGEMVADYLENRPERFSEFIKILERADKMDLLDTYGSFTCFAPTNRAVEEYLALYNLSSVEELSAKQCDTIANSHLINRAYFTTDMTAGVISTPNQFDRYLSISFVVADSLSGTMAYFINKQSQIVLRDDSVENGVVHTIDKVIRPSNSLLPELMREDTTIRLFYEAMVLTTFDDSLLLYMDYDYVQPKLVLHYTSHVNRETAIAPKYRKYGYTGFVEPDEVYRQKGINNMNDLIAYAKKVYDEVYPQDANLYDDDFTHPKNPLNRFVAYHFMPRTGYYNKLTTTLCLITSIIDPIEFYETMCPNTMFKISGTTGLYMNRRVDNKFNIRGALIQPPGLSSTDQNAINGTYHYIDDILAYSKEVEEIVFNTRFRFDTGALFPEFMTNNVRHNQDRQNYYFPNGYTEKAELTSETKFIYRYQHENYDCHQGDEINFLGQYDITITLPPVPEGTYEIRLGYTALPTRGISQMYVDGEPTGIPVDLRIGATDPKIGWIADERTDDNGVQNDKDMRNHKAMKAPDSMRRLNGNVYVVFRTESWLFRRILVTKYLTQEPHTLRFRNVIDDLDAEFMFDYIEIVPKSVYDSEEGEDRH